MARYYRSLFHFGRRPSCTYCQVSFQAHRKDARYCSAACRQAASRARRRTLAATARRRTRNSLYRAARTMTPEERDHADARMREEAHDEPVGS